MSKFNLFWTYVRRYKYLFVVLLFVLLVGFIDENSFLQRYYLQSQIRELKQEIRRYTDRYNSDTGDLESLRSDPETVVRIARERYYMQRPNEDVFVVREAPAEMAENVQEGGE